MNTNKFYAELLDADDNILATRLFELPTLSHAIGRTRNWARSSVFHFHRLTHFRVTQLSNYDSYTLSTNTRTLPLAFTQKENSK
jgi:hypothetical protein